MARNNNADFVGLAALKKRHAEQIAEFEAWATAGYGGFHHNHYDWWAFPINEPSSKGWAWVVLEGDVEELKRDKEFLQKLKRGMNLLCTSWGWDLPNAREIPQGQRTQHQKWQASVCAKLFGLDVEFNSMRDYARILLQRGAEFRFHSKDLTPLFLAEERPPPPAPPKEAAAKAGGPNSQSGPGGAIRVPEGRVEPPPQADGGAKAKPATQRVDRFCDFCPIM